MEGQRHGAKAAKSCWNSADFAGASRSPATFAGVTQGRVARMDLEQASDLIRETLTLALILSAPMLLIGLVVGVIVSLLQAVTQIQEQTLSLIPKLAAMVAAAILLMPWIGHRLMEYATTMFGSGLTP
jgi:flagellar biosynthetic protein FliQ